MILLLDFLISWPSELVHKAFFGVWRILNPVSSLIAPVPVLTKDSQDLDLSV